MKITSSRSVFQAWLSASFLAAACWLAMTSLAHAQTTQEQSPAGLSLTMLWNVAWSDENGTPYREQPVLSLEINCADLTKSDMAEIAALRSLSNLKLGWAPEGLEIASADLSPLSNLQALKALALCIKNAAGLRLDFLKSLHKLEHLEIWRHTMPGDSQLDAARGRLTLNYEDAAMIGQLPGLESLELNNLDNLNDAVIALVTASGRLQWLRLVAPEMTDASLTYIAANRDLDLLGLTAPNLSDEVGARVAELKKLTNLTIDSRQTSARTLQAISKLRELTFFSLRLPSASPADFALLRAMTQLKVFRLDDCAVSANAIRELAGHPNLEAVYLPAAEDTPAAREIIINLPRLTHAQLGRWKFTTGR